jgi:hypothetical protein
MPLLILKSYLAYYLWLLDYNLSLHEKNLLSLSAVNGSTPSLLEYQAEEEPKTGSYVKK